MGIKGFKKLLTLFLILILTTVTLLAGCSKDDNSESASSDKKDNDEPITLTFFDKNTGDTFDNEVAKEITKRTGVKFEIQQPTGNPMEKLNLMLASGDLADIILMDRGSDLVNKYIQAGSLIPLNDLIDKYGQNVKEMYGDTLNKTRYSDGKNYYLANWYGLEKEPVLGMLMRMDLLKELGVGEKVNNGEPFTAEEYYTLLKTFKEKYPTLNGHETIPLTINAENIGSALTTFKGMWGMKSFYENDGKLQYDVKDTRYQEMLLFINKLYREGLIDKEWAVNKTQLWNQKLSNGYTFATVGAYWDANEANNVLKKSDGAENVEKQFYAYKVAAPGVDASQTTFGPRSSLGWDAIGITSANKNPEKTMKVIDFLASEEGQYLLMWGIEGKHWEIADGKHQPKEDVLQKYKEDEKFAKSTGIRKWTWFIKNGAGTDGTPYDLTGKYEKDAIATVAYKNLEDTVWDTSIYDNLGPAAGTPESLMSQKVSDIIDSTIPKIINSSTEADAKALYEKMLKELEKVGLVKVEKVINENFKERQDLWQ
ncbi:putative aldouronate transport system substrate-binding protein [Bacillus niacini]|uniref:Aldouronate transport system substrate-binding protein n=1 Tax=Neobacillus niacini TaxID=86668 RepID=A0A852TG91_9BACI|nr:extracellular solute-binding protein [Neobacillus niacini]NYE07930.1 putative aldouronate transport system substrate-binding protein [Neobacillus niacini]